MTVTLNLPPDVEQAFIGEAASKGLTPDQLASEVLLKRAAWQHGGVSTGAESSSALPQLKDGVPELHTGRPMALHVTGEPLSWFA